MGKIIFLILSSRNVLLLKLQQILHKNTPLHDSYSFAFNWRAIAEFYISRYKETLTLKTDKSYICSPTKTRKLNFVFLNGIQSSKQKNCYFTRKFQKIYNAFILIKYSDPLQSI